MRLALFEDQASAGFVPIAWMRPVFELLCGQFSLRERLLRCQCVSEWGAFLRPFLAEMYEEAQPEARVNDFKWLGHEPTLLINGRWLPDVDGVRRLEHVANNEAGIIDQTVVWLRLDPSETSLLTWENWDDTLL